uniref:Regulator of G-protein signaling 8 n=1 Tax=Nomascus leucogenys TaxID=61853 RepID=A0A2I3HR92_NOMLE
MAALLMPRRNKGMRTRLGCLSHKSDSCSDFTAILPDKPNRALNYLRMYKFTVTELQESRRLSTEEATRWADSFDVLLSHKFTFLSIGFLICKMRSKARLLEHFAEVNIDFQTREATRKNLQEPSLTCFDQAQGKVHSLMEKDSYPRFLRSKMYLDLLSQSQRRLS